MRPLTWANHAVDSQTLNQRQLAAVLVLQRTAPSRLRPPDQWPVGAESGWDFHMSQTRLAKLAGGASTKSAERTLNELVRLGYLVRVKRGHGAGAELNRPGRATVWRLNLPPATRQKGREAKALLPDKTDTHYPTIAASHYQTPVSDHLSTGPREYVSIRPPAAADPQGSLPTDPVVALDHQESSRLKGREPTTGSVGGSSQTSIVNRHEANARASDDPDDHEAERARQKHELEARIAAEVTPAAARRSFRVG